MAKKEGISSSIVVEFNETTTDSQGQEIEPFVEALSFEEKKNNTERKKNVFEWTDSKQKDEIIKRWWCLHMKKMKKKSINYT